MRVGLDSGGVLGPARSLPRHCFLFLKKFLSAHILQVGPANLSLLGSCVLFLIQILGCNFKLEGWATDKRGDFVLFCYGLIFANFILNEPKSK